LTPGPSGAIGWVDDILVIGKRKMKNMFGLQMQRQKKRWIDEQTCQ